jgi:formate hydrogenlyase subunit 6/NADH:ubiquinone oxidoreductase subunit I
MSLPQFKQYIFILFKGKMKGRITTLINGHILVPQPYKCAYYVRKCIACGLCHPWSWCGMGKLKHLQTPEISKLDIRISS